MLEGGAVAAEGHRPGPGGSRPNPTARCARRCGATRPSSPACSSPTSASILRVAAIVPHAVLSLQAQTPPPGVSRVFGQSSPIAGIDGLDERVDADVAIVDTGIDQTHRDLNVVGGQNCSTSNRAAGRTTTGMGPTWPARWVRWTTGSAWWAWRPASASGPSASSTRPVRARLLVRVRSRLDRRPAGPRGSNAAAVRGGEHVRREDRAPTTTTAASRTGTSSTRRSAGLSGLA